MFFKKRSDKVSPIDIPPLRLPGESLDEQRVDKASDILTWLVMAAFAILMAALEWYQTLLHLPPSPWAATSVAIAAVGLAIAKVRRPWRELQNIRQGIKGERAVGQMLEELRAKGYRVIHDVPGSRGDLKFNVDHVLVGPAGVFVIETKTISKPIRGKVEVKYDGSKVLVNGLEPDRDPVAQAEAGVSYIRRIVESDCGKRPPMRGVVLYPGWFVERQPKGVKVWVLNPKGLSSFIEHEDSTLSDDDAAAVARAIEKHVRAQA